MTRGVLAAAFAGALGAGTALAQPAWPTKPITFVVPNGAGASTDTQMRLVGTELAKRLGQPVLVSNKPGGNTQIAAESVARAEPDGYTLLITTNTSHAANVSLYKSLRYDPVQDFTPIIRMGRSIFVMLVHPSVEAATLAEFLDYARRRPGQLSYAYAVSTGQIASELLRRRAGLEMTAVPYNSSPRAMGDLIGGQFAMYIADPVTARPAIASGKVRALATTGAAESPLLPGIPTIAATLPGVTVVSWNGLFGPARLPRAIVDRIASETAAILADPAMRAKFADLGVELQPSASPAEFADFVRDQIGVWSRLIRDAGIAPQ